MAWFGSPAASDPYMVAESRLDAANGDFNATSEWLRELRRNGSRQPPPPPPAPSESDPPPLPSAQLQQPELQERQQPPPPELAPQPSAGCGRAKHHRPPAASALCSVIVCQSVWIRPNCGDRQEISAVSVNSKFMNLKRNQRSLRRPILNTIWVQMHRTPPRSRASRTSTCPTRSAHR